MSAPNRMELSLRIREGGRFQIRVNDFPVGCCLSAQSEAEMVMVWLRTAWEDLLMEYTSGLEMKILNDVEFYVEDDIIKRY